MAAFIASIPPEIIYIMISLVYHCPSICLRIFHYFQKLQIFLIRDHLFSPYEIFSKKLRFFTP